MKKILSILSSAVILFSPVSACFANELASEAPHIGASHEIANLSADETLQKLKDGNKRFYTKHLKHPDQSYKRRMEGVNGQHPFVIVITCSDSRVAPEIIFDEGLGDIFEIRNAGNVLDDHVIGSVEYAVAHLGVNLVVVIGHEDCGAVKATIAHNKETPHIESLVKSIEPALIAVSENADNKLEKTIKMNAIIQAKELTKSEPLISEHIKEKGLQIIPAYYDIHTGKIEFLK